MSINLSPDHQPVRHSNLYDHLSMPYRNSRLLPYGLGLTVLLILLSYDQLRFGLNVPPAVGGDEPEYDSLAWEMSQGRGYRLNLADPVFRLPYEDYWHQAPQHSLAPNVAGLTASRPPLFPIVLAGLNQLFGRQFWSVRLLNALCMAIVGGLLASFLMRHKGWQGACLGLFLFVVVDYRTRLYGRTLLTEPLATLLTTVLLLILVRYWRRPLFRNAAAAGVVLGLMVLTRSQFILWAPPLTGLMAVLSYRQRSGISQFSHSRFSPRKAVTARVVIFAASLCFVLAPWMIRNCRVLGEMMPLGTQGAAQLPAGFSDAAWALQGYWKNLSLTGFYDPVLQPGMTRLEQEVAMAKYGKQQAQQWIFSHPVKAVLLAPLKIGHELLVRRPLQIVLMILAGCGLWSSWKMPEIQIGCWLFLFNCLAVGMTWTVDDGRFFVPLMFLEDALAAIGLMAIFRLRASCSRLGLRSVRFD